MSKNFYDLLNEIKIIYDATNPQEKIVGISSNIDLPQTNFERLTNFLRAGVISDSEEHNKVLLYCLKIAMDNENKEDLLNYKGNSPQDFIDFMESRIEEKITFENYYLSSNSIISRNKMFFEIKQIIYYSADELISFFSNFSNTWHLYRLNSILVLKK